MATIKYVVGVFQLWRKGHQMGATLVEKFDADLDITGVSHWRAGLRERFAKRGVIVEAINIFSEPHEGCKVGVVLREGTRGFARKKPITRGGKPIEGPTKVRTVDGLVR